VKEPLSYLTVLPGKVWEKERERGVKRR
jgi:hypothetical protein